MCKLSGIGVIKLLFNFLSATVYLNTKLSKILKARYVQLKLQNR
jgi:hypothetical protein